MNKFQMNFCSDFNPSQSVILLHSNTFNVEKEIDEEMMFETGSQRQVHSVPMSFSLTNVMNISSCKHTRNQDDLFLFFFSRQQVSR